MSVTRGLKKFLFPQTLANTSVAVEMWEMTLISPREVLQHFQDEAVDDAAAVGRMP